MRRKIRLGILLLGGALLLFMLIELSKVTYALGSDNTELTFVIVDAETGQPIPKAVVVLIEEGRPVQTVKLLTDEQGVAKLVRENVGREDVFGPLRETRTSFYFAGLLLTVSAKGYTPLDFVELHTTPFEDKGRSDDGHFARLEFKLRLAKAQAR
jgi:hypothetical protein